MQSPISLSDKQARLIQQHLDLVLKANELVNLTRIQDKEEAELLHVEDSLQGIPECLEAPAGRYADLGSGGGFPGFAVAVVTGRDTLLVESVKKKTELLALFADELGLADAIQVYGHCAEELALEAPESFALITPVPSLHCRLLLNWLRRFLFRAVALLHTRQTMLMTSWIGLSPFKKSWV